MINYFIAEMLSEKCEASGEVKSAILILFVAISRLEAGWRFFCAISRDFTIGEISIVWDTEQIREIRVN
jgi:hypothetical protein